MYPETTTNPSVVEQNTTEVVGIVSSARNVGAKQSQDIITDFLVKIQSVAIVNSYSNKLQ